MVKIEGGIVEYDGDAIMLTADACTIVLAVRDKLCEQVADPNYKERIRTAYEKSIIRVLAMPLGQSDEQRSQFRKNP